MGCRKVLFDIPAWNLINLCYFDVGIMREAKNDCNLVRLVSGRVKNILDVLCKLKCSFHLSGSSVRIPM